MKILKAEQIRDLDFQTIQKEPIASIDLMERASNTFVSWLLEWADPQAGPVQIFCGPGNNGGDGLAVARLLAERHFDVLVFICAIGTLRSEDFQMNLQRLEGKQLSPQIIEKDTELPELSPEGYLIDAIFGSGLNRTVEGYWATLLEHLNQSTALKIAIDIPSGMFADQSTSGISFEADYTFSFEFPKLGFLLPENAHRVGEWHARSIQLLPEAIASAETPYFLLEPQDVRPMLRVRKKFDHKGSYGHCLLIAGGYGKVGAAILTAKAALRSGAGLVTVHAPKCAYPILQIGFPEAMVSIDPHEFVFSEAPDISRYQSLGVGPGIGTNELSQEALQELLNTSEGPVVLDADALNILSLQKKLLSQIPKNSILSPHPKEFERLFGPSPDHFARLELLREKAGSLESIIILKGANTCIALPDGRCFFNSTGNPGMGTGGSGDVLTGLLAGLLAQGYTSEEAAILGVYLHGLAGDLAAEELQQEALLASDIIQHLGKAFAQLKSTA